MRHRPGEDVLRGCDAAGADGRRAHDAVSAHAAGGRAEEDSVGRAEADEEVHEVLFLHGGLDA